jgi:arylsulfatase A-like enzyme
VPLIVHWPKGLPPPAHYEPGTVENGLHEAIDLAPTMLTFAGAPVPPKMQGRLLFGPNAGAPREYAFGARDRCDETVFRLRTVRDDSYRYIRNFTPEQPFLAKNNYKEKQYPVWTLLPQLMAEGKLAPPQAALCAPHMPPEELYDLQADPHEIHNLAADPAQQAVLQRLRGVLEKWIEETNDQGRTPEPEAVVQAQGATKAETNPQKGYTQDGGTAAGVVKPAQ